MLDAFLFIGLPYLALGLLVGGTAWRIARRGHTVSSLSSQTLEQRLLPLGSIPWHLGILVVLAGHLVAVLAPAPWAALTSHREFLLGVEVVGLAAALLCAFGLTILIARRLGNARLQAVTSGVDLVILALLLVQVLLGIGVALSARWGAQWSTGTTTPYLYSLLRLAPDASYLDGMPAIIKLHLALAWVIFALVPFSRLVHAFVVPVHYLWRLPQRVVWNTARRRDRLAEAAGGTDPELGRRAMLKGTVGVSAASALMVAGVAGKVGGFFRGPELSHDEQRERLANRLDRLEMTAEERALELERLEKDAIEVARLSELASNVGKYFIDYAMSPALAFVHKDTGLPILISARCTHLSCTVGNTVDEQDRILCPCHISYFDIHTGQPNDGAPAKSPLPHIAWVIKDPKGEVVASQDAAGHTTGTLDPTARDTYTVFIARPETA